MSPLYKEKSLFAFQDFKKMWNSKGLGCSLRAPKVLAFIFINEFLNGIKNIINLD